MFWVFGSSLQIDRSYVRPCAATTDSSESIVKQISNSHPHQLMGEMTSLSVGRCGPPLLFPPTSTSMSQHWTIGSFTASLSAPHWTHDAFAVVGRENSRDRQAGEIQRETRIDRAQDSMDAVMFNCCEGRAGGFELPHGSRLDACL